MRKDITGLEFGNLTAIKPCGFNKHRNVLWLCKCKCGKLHIASAGDIISGNTKSCGCLKNRPKHGQAGSRLYRIWQYMKQRCNNPKHEAYHTYGGRGIKVCKEWEHDFAAFREWADAHGYADNLEIDRIDNSKGYSPDNCRWITHKNNCNNRRTSLFVEIEGVKHTLPEWADISGIDYRSIYNRYYRGIRGAELIKPLEREKKT